MAALTFKQIFSLPFEARRERKRVIESARTCLDEAAKAFADIITEPRLTGRKLEREIERKSADPSADDRDSKG